MLSKPFQVYIYLPVEKIKVFFIAVYIIIHCVCPDQAGMLCSSPCIRSTSVVILFVIYIYKYKKKTILMYIMYRLTAAQGCQV